VSAVAATAPGRSVSAIASASASSAAASRPARREAFAPVERGGFVEVAPIGFADFAARWIETYARPNTKASTCRDYEGSIRNHLVPYFGNVELRHITREMVQRYLADKARSQKADGTPTWTPKTINGTLVPLREMLSHAVDWGYLESSPAAMVKPLRREPTERRSSRPTSSRSSSPPRRVSTRCSLGWRRSSGCAGASFSG